MKLPQEITHVLNVLHGAGFEAYAVGGCVRDLLLGRTPKDWDVTTNAKPEEIQKLFPKNFYTNRFGTVTVLAEGKITEVEVTTYRVDVGYSDARHPDEVKFTAKLENDLARRDFTVNAMAMTPTPAKSGDSPFVRGSKFAPPYEGGVSERSETGVVVDGTYVIDPFGGIKNLHAKVIRAVGEPAERFQEDALRLMRAVRLGCELGFEIEENTLAAIKAQAGTIANVSQERIRDEFVKIVMSDQPERGMNLLRETELLPHILPELMEGVGVRQNKHHIYTVFDHNVKSLQFAAKYGYPLHIRLAALLHDIGKPKTKRPEGSDFTFHAHEFVGARMAEAALKRLRFPSELIQQVRHLVRYHMFYYDVGKVTEAGARRLLRRVGGMEKFQDLVKLRIAERKGSGVPKAEPYRLRHLQFLIEKASAEPITVGQLKIKGGDLVKGLKMTPGPAFGGILNALLAEVLDDPVKNDREYLLKRAAELKDKDPVELKKLGEVAVEEAEKDREEDIRRRYRV